MQRAWLNSTFCTNELAFLVSTCPTPTPKVEIKRRRPLHIFVILRAHTGLGCWGEKGVLEVSLCYGHFSISVFVRMGYLWASDTAWVSSSSRWADIGDCPCDVQDGSFGRDAGAGEGTVCGALGYCALPSLQWQMSWNRVFCPEGRCPRCGGSKAGTRQA